MSDLAQELLKIFLPHGLRLVTAESCTGGMVAAAITDMPGSSKFFECGFVTYSNQAKQDMLGVPAEIIENYGAVSEQCAAVMAAGALRNTHADISVSITGIAGPDGGSDEKPVGLVYLAVTYKGKTKVMSHNFEGDRSAIRKQAVESALAMLIEVVKA